MTLDEVVRVASMCAKGRGLECRNNECPLYSVDYCIRELLGNAVTYLSMYRAGIPLEGSAPKRIGIPTPAQPGCDIIGEIMSHYKKPFVTIEINISEDET